jgi:type VI secretion system secreted protein Hcp
MSYDVLVSVTGARQGAFKGESTQKGRELKFSAVSISFGLAIPHDASGQATSRLQLQPLVISKEWGASSPQFLAAAASNERLDLVVIEFYAQTKTGVSSVDHNIRLTNANIVQIDDSFQISPTGRELQTITLYYEKLEISAADGGTAILESSNS